MRVGDLVIIPGLERLKQVELWSPGCPSPLLNYADKTTEITEIRSDLSYSRISDPSERWSIEDIEDAGWDISEFYSYNLVRLRINATWWWRSDILILNSEKFIKADKLPRGKFAPGDRVLLLNIKDIPSESFTKFNQVLFNKDILINQDKIHYFGEEYLVKQVKSFKGLILYELKGAHNDGIFWNFLEEWLVKV